MIRKLSILVFSAFILAAMPHARSSQTLCDGFLPENDLKIEVGSLEAKGITEAQFNAVLDVVQEIYKPVVAQRGGTLVIDRRWDDPTVNASAMQWGSTWIINMYGGLARHETITQDGFALVACHEMGHHVGGAPKIGTRWASNEGQSDYFATLKCLRKVYRHGGAGAFSRPLSANPFAKKMCDERFSAAADRAACMRNAGAGMSVAKLFQVLRGEAKAPRFDTPDPAVVGETQDKHPATQCRIDTYFSGGLCPKPDSENVSRSDPSVGTCTRAEGFAWETRSRCWYKPPAGMTDMLLVRQAIDESPLRNDELPATFRKEGSVFSALRRMADSSR
ncbi:MAG: hypothetical protein ABIJ96_05620 [Elusimicrobiota bacterium]